MIVIADEFAGRLIAGGQVVIQEVTNGLQCRSIAYVRAKEDIVKTSGVQ